MKKMNENRESELEQFYQNLDAVYASGDLEKVEQLLLTCEESWRQESENASMLVAVYNELGSLYRSVSRYEESMEAFKKAKKQIEFKLGRKCTEYATLINNMAGTCRMAKDYDEAIRLFKEAIAIYQAIGEMESYAYASVLNNIALVYQETGRLEPAVQYLKKALSMIESMPGHEQEIAVTYSNLNVLYQRMGDTRRAMECLEKSIHTFESCKDEENVHYAAALNSMGAFLYSEGKYEEAIHMYERAAEYTKRFFGENIEYGITFYNMYWVYRKMNQMAKAIEVLTIAERIYARVYGEQHEKTTAIREEIKRMTEKVS